VAVVDPANPNLHRLQAALEELWADVVGPEDAFDDEFGDFDDEDDFDDGGMLVRLHSSIRKPAQWLLFVSAELDQTQTNSP